VGRTKSTTQKPLKITEIPGVVQDVYPELELLPFCKRQAAKAAHFAAWFSLRLESGLPSVRLYQAGVAGRRPAISTVRDGPSEHYEQRGAFTKQ